MFTILPYLLCNVYAESSQAVYWWVIATGGTQAVWGLLQIYGVYGSSHSLFRLAGSFYNPGPKAFTDMKMRTDASSSNISIYLRTVGVS